MRSALKHQASLKARSNHEIRRAYVNLGWAVQSLWTWRAGWLRHDSNFQQEPAAVARQTAARSGNCAISRRAAAHRLRTVDRSRLVPDQPGLAEGRSVGEIDRGVRR